MADEKKPAEKKSTKPSPGTEENPRTFSNDRDADADFFIDDAITTESPLLREGYTVFYEVVESLDSGKNWSHVDTYNTLNKAQKMLRSTEDLYRGRWVREREREWDREHNVGKEAQRLDLVVTARTTEKDIDAMAARMRDYRDELKKSTETRPVFKKKDAEIPMLAIHKILVNVKREMP